MKNYPNLSATELDSRLFSGVHSNDDDDDECSSVHHKDMPSMRDTRFRRRNNHPTTTTTRGLEQMLDCDLPAASRLDSLSAMKQLNRENNMSSTYNNIINIDSSSKSQSSQQTTKMYFTMRTSACRHAAQQVVNMKAQSLRHHRPRRAGILAEKWSKPLLCGLLVTLTLTSCLLIGHTSALENNSPEASSQSVSSKSSSQDATSSKADTSAKAASDSTSSSASSSSSQSSIVASLSSAVATAAAAAAVAAAQSSLSSNDARSLGAGSGHHHNSHNHGLHGQTQRSPGLNLAIKLVDTIPEVPYNILHNMKKLDHAAPFYNVPNKLSGGTTKESAAPQQSLLATALTAASTGNLGGAAEQLSSLFKSPLWKRIADGYGDFASEFRSLFRAPGATPMKGPASPTSKLLRDISVPALLMLLASSFSGEWRPVRTRRKSFRPVDISSSSPGALQSNLISQQESIPSFLAAAAAAAAAAEAAPPQQQQQQQQQQQTQRYEQNLQPQSFDQRVPYSNNFSPASSSPNGEWLNEQQQQQQQQQSAMNSRYLQQIGHYTNMVNGEPNLKHSALPLDSQPNWLSSSQVVAASELNSQLMSHAGGQDQRLNFDPQQITSASGLQQQQQQQSQAVRRSDEIISPSLNSITTSPTFRSSGSSMNLATLASVVQGGKLISQLLDRASGSGGAGNTGAGSYRMMHLLSGHNGGGDMPAANSPIKRSQLSDDQRYSLIGSDESSAPASTKRAHILSTMAHAVTSMLSPANDKAANGGGKSGSETAAASDLYAPAKKAAGFLSRASLQNLIIANRTINHEDSVFMRRQPAEQRDLTKLLPESWREIMKRTMSTVQQQANTQWKSIEGQLATWVQDKLKTVAASATSGASSGSSASGSSSSSSASHSPLGASVPAPIGNMLASMSSTALNIFGLNKNNSSSPSAAAAAAAATAAAATTTSQQAKSQPSGDESSVSAIQRVSTSSQSKQSNKPQKSQTLGDLAVSALANSVVSSIASKYPTVTAAQRQPDDSTLAKSSMAASPTTTLQSSSSAASNQQQQQQQQRQSTHSSPQVPIAQSAAQSVAQQPAAALSESSSSSSAAAAAAAAAAARPLD